MAVCTASNRSGIGGFIRFASLSWLQSRFLHRSGDILVLYEYRYAQAPVESGARVCLVQRGKGAPEAMGCNFDAG